MSTTITQCDTNESTAACSELAKQTYRPKADIYEGDDAWFVVLEMPGIDEQGADVSIEKHVLTVSGEVNALNIEGFDQHDGEFAARRFERSFRLPEEVDSSAIEAHVKNGLLRLKLPKAAAALPHKVTVKAG